MNDSTTNMVLSAIRTLLAFGAGLLVREGFLDAQTAVELVGALMVLGPLIWGIWEKHQTEKLTKARETVAVQAGVAATQSGDMRRPPETITPAKAQEIIAEHAPA